MFKWKATYTVTARNSTPFGVETVGTIEFQSGTDAFPSQPIPEPIPDIKVHIKHGPQNLEVGDTLSGEFRDSFGGWPAIEVSSEKGRLAFSLESQADKVYKK